MVCSGCVGAMAVTSPATEGPFLQPRRFANRSTEWPDSLGQRGGRGACRRGAPHRPRPLRRGGPLLATAGGGDSGGRQHRPAPPRRATGRRAGGGRADGKPRAIDAGPAGDVVLTACRSPPGRGVVAFPGGPSLRWDDGVVGDRMTFARPCGQAAPMRVRAARYCASMRSTRVATVSIASTAPMPWPDPQMSRHAFAFVPPLSPVPKSIVL